MISKDDDFCLKKCTIIKIKLKIKLLEFIIELKGIFLNKFELFGFLEQCMNKAKSI